MCGFIAQLVEHRAGVAEVTGLNPIEVLIFFFRLFPSNCLNFQLLKLGAGGQEPGRLGAGGGRGKGGKREF